MWKFFNGMVDHITCPSCESYNFSYVHTRSHTHKTSYNKLLYKQRLWLDKELLSAI